MQLLCVWHALVNHTSMTDSCFIDDTSSKKNTTCHTWLILPRHPAAVAAVSVSLSHVPAPTSMLQGLVVCVVSDKLGCFFPLSYVWLAGWSHAGRVCLSDASCARDQSRAADRDHRSVPTQTDQLTNLPVKDMGVFTPNSPNLTV